MQYRIDINGMSHDVDVPKSTPLLGVIRDDLGLTGAKYGCGHGVCGSCYVLVDGNAVAACKLTIDEVAGKSIVTIEGLAKGGVMHTLQKAFIAADAMQCGFCTPGMLMSAAALLSRIPKPTEAEVRTALEPHLCRCGVYGRVIRAVLQAAA